MIENSLHKLAEIALNSDFEMTSDKAGNPKIKIRKKGKI